MDEAMASENPSHGGVRLYIDRANARKLTVPSTSIIDGSPAAATVRILCSRHWSGAGLPFVVAVPLSSAQAGLVARRSRWQRIIWGGCIGAGMVVAVMALLAFLSSVFGDSAWADEELRMGITAVSIGLFGCAAMVANMKLFRQHPTFYDRKTIVINEVHFLAAREYVRLNGEHAIRVLVSEG